MMRMIIPNFSAAIGSTMSKMIMEGIAPIKGPKNGMMFVTPTTTLMSIVIGISNIVSTTKQRMPIIAESMIFPLIKPPKV